MQRVPAVIVDRRGTSWVYQYGHLYAAEGGRVMRHAESFAPKPLRRRTV